MAKLEEIVAGSSILGINETEAVTVVAVQWYGSNVIEITYKNIKGIPGTQLVYREDEPTITIQKNSLPWSFDADGDKVRLASEAYRISLAHLFDPYLAVHTSSVEPLPHQISAVYQEMLPKLPLRYVLADDPGAGKTIMTGLLIKELIVRGDLKRCLIVSPGSLAEQWQDELFQKFHLHFDILTNERIESAASGNIFTEVDLCIDSYKRSNSNCKALETVNEMLNSRGPSPRIFRNMLAFVAPDEDNLNALRAEVKRYIAWESINSEKEELNLDANQVRETENNLARSNHTVELRIKETYCWFKTHNG